MVAIIILRSWVGAVMFLVAITAAMISLGWGWHLPHTVDTTFRWIMGGGGILICFWLLFGASSKQ